MRHSSRFAWVLAVLSLLCTKLAASEPLLWESNLERAQQIAAQSNRLVLVHFWATWCGPCKWMDAEVFSQPEVARQIMANYVPVKLEYDRNQELANKLGVSGLPSDVILTPQGHVVNVTKGKADAAQYVAHLNQCSTSVRQQNAGILAALPTGSPTNSANLPPNYQPLAAAPANPVLPNPAAPQPVTPQPVAPAPAYGQSLTLNGPVNGVNLPPANGMLPQPVAPAMNPNLGPANTLPLVNNAPPAGNANINNAVATLTQNPPSSVMPPLNAPSNMPSNVGQPSNIPPRNVAQPPSVNPPTTNPPIALDGFCPVSLAEKQQWIPGDKRWGAYHQGRTYLFAGPEEQSRFLANYDCYSPVASGIDIVLAMEERKSVPGMREHGVFFRNRIFLFANEDTLKKFSANPFYYLDQSQAASRQAANASQQPR